MVQIKLSKGGFVAKYSRVNISRSRQIGTARQVRTIRALTCVLMNILINGKVDGMEPLTKCVDIKVQSRLQTPLRTGLEFKIITWDWKKKGLKTITTNKPNLKINEQQGPTQWKKKSNYTNIYMRRKKTKKRQYLGVLKSVVDHKLYDRTTMRCCYKQNKSPSQMNRTVFCRTYEAINLFVSM